MATAPEDPDTASEDPDATPHLVSLDGVASFLRTLTARLLRHSAEGTLAIRDVVQRCGSAYGVDVQISVLPEQAVLAVRSGEESRTFVVNAAPSLTRLDLVSARKQLVRRVEEEQLPLTEASQELNALEGRPPPFPWWLRVIGVTLFAAGFAPSVQATWEELGKSIALGVVMGLLFVACEGRRFEPLLPPLGAFVVAVVAFVVLDAESSPGGPVLLMIPALFVLIPGDYLSAAAVELATGQLSAGAVRLVYSLFVIVSLAVGVILAAAVTGVGTSALFEAEVPDNLPYWLIVLSWIPFTLGLAWTFNADLRDWPWMLLLVYVAWLVLQLGTWAFGATAGTFAAGIALGVLGEWLSHRPDRPPRLVLVLGGFFALTVGALGLRGVTTLVGGHPVQGFTDLLNMATIAIALTFGLITGALLAPRPRRPAGEGALDRLGVPR